MRFKVCSGIIFKWVFWCTFPIDTPTTNLIVVESNIIKEVHYFIYYDTSHDTLYVQHAFMLQWNHLQSVACNMNNHIIWTDGCSSQFKRVRAWYFVSRYPSLTTFNGNPKVYQLVWNFFITRHGKGEVDGARALLKWEVRKE